MKLKVMIVHQFSCENNSWARVFYCLCVCVFFVLFCFVFFSQNIKKGIHPTVGRFVRQYLFRSTHFGKKKKKKKKKKSYETKTVINIEGHLVKIETFIFRLKTGQRKSNPDRTTNNKLQKIN